MGNSLAIRIPKPLAEDAEAKEGTVLNLAVSDGKVVAILCKKETIAQANARQGDSCPA
jgi:antitoxin component of MazEF toxin-antitoxin module